MSYLFNALSMLIGLAFDGNYEALSHKLAFDKDLNRTINVDIRYVLWCIDKLGGAQNLIKERAKTALQRRASFKPYKVANPVRLDVTFKSYRPAEILAYLPIVERTTSHAIRYNGRNIIDVMRFMVFVGAYTVELDP